VTTLHTFHYVEAVVVGWCSRSTIDRVAAAVVVVLCRRRLRMMSTRIEDDGIAASST